MKKLLLPVLLISGFLNISCEKNEDNPQPQKAPLIVPSVYDSANYAANTTTQASVLTALSDQVAEARKGRTSGTLVTFTALQNLYNAGSPSLKTVSTTYYAGKMDGVGGYMDELAKASGGTYTPGTPTGQGGTFGTGSSSYLFDENGVEYEQLIEKGQFGAVLFKHASDLLTGPVSLATVNQVVAIFGTNPTFPNTSTNKAPQPDKFMAVYAARRSDSSNTNSLYNQLKFQFIKLQAALKAGDNYKPEQQEAIAGILLVWEKINGATIINYCQQATTTLSSTTVTDNQKASALHAIGEGIGFAHGFKTINQNSRKITDTQLDEILVLFNAPASGTPTVYKFVTESVNELPKLQQIITKVKGIYGFTDNEVASFANNWVNLQNR